MTQDYTKSHRITVPDWYKRKRKTTSIWKWTHRVGQALAGTYCLKHSCTKKKHGWYDEPICKRCFEERKERDKNE